MRPDGELLVSGLQVRYGDVLALHGVDLGVPPGKMVAVTGPSGAGKSSLLWAVAGALTPSAGQVLVGRRAVVDRASAATQGVVLMPQGNGLASTLTAEENLLVPLVAAGIGVREARERVSTALGVVDLQESAGHLVEELSGGQQQRIAFARALAMHAGLLLVDEPTSDLDSGNRGRVMEALRAEAEAGAVVVMATHDPEAAAATDAELALDEGVMRWVRLPSV